MHSNELDATWLRKWTSLRTSDAMKLDKSYFEIQLLDLILSKGKNSSKPKEQFRIKNGLILVLYKY